MLYKTNQFLWFIRKRAWILNQASLIPKLVCFLLGHKVFGD